MTLQDFLRKYGSIYEHSPWVAEQVWHSGEADKLDLMGLVGAMKKIVDDAGRDQKLTLLRAHPDLAGKAAIAGELSDHSTVEQKGAGLDQCSRVEFDELQTLNADYKDKFGFPFIIAVRGLDRFDILASIRQRGGHSAEDEFRTALTEVHKIARLRLEQLAQS